MLKVMHLSDIHFGFTLPSTGSKRQSSHYFTAGAAGAEQPDSARLATLLRQARSNDRIPDLVVISGDVGWSGADEDYQYALEFCRNVSQAWDGTHIVVVPGNHDVDFSEKVAPDERQRAFEKFLLALHGESWERRYPLLRSPDAAHLAPRERLVSIDVIDDAALVVGVNSAAHINGFGERGPVYVSAELLTLITQHLARERAWSRHDALRIFVMHHHLLPFVDPPWGDSVNSVAPPDKPDPTIVANSAQLQVWLAANRFDIVLHGHKHMPHGRFDRLWHRNDSGNSKRHTAIVGAGSAGVYRHEIPAWQRLSLNEIEFSKIDAERWNAQVRVVAIFPEQPGRALETQFEYGFELGEPASARPLSVVSSRMDLCHQAIADHCRRQRVIRNFTSVVTNATFVLPPTARIGNEPVEMKDIKNCFSVLHPEYGENGYGWDLPDEVRARLQDVPRRFAFQHGPRIFGVPGKTSWSDVQPIRRALDALDKSDTRGYLSLVSTESDVLAEFDRQPIPALVGLQFIKDSERLDLVATFRALELSFWWVVNMYEAGLLLEWAAGTRNLRPGTITMFAAQADWNDDPHPSSLTTLDQIAVSDLAELAIARTAEDVRQLRALLIEKKAHTNIFDLDPKGLRTLADLLKMRVSREDSSLLKAQAGDLVKTLEAAADEIERALRNPDERRARVKAAERELDRVLGLIPG